jgi:hypothetical protein
MPRTRKAAAAKRGTAKRTTAKRETAKRETEAKPAGRRSKFDINQRDVDKLQKQGHTLESAAEELGVSASSLSKPFYKAEVNNDPDLDISGTPKQVAKKIVALRDEGVRWARLSVYSDKSIAEVKRIYSEETGIDADETWTGRGRPPAGMTVAEAREMIGVDVSNGDEPTPRSRKTKATTPKRATAKRSAAAKAKAKTRAERQAKSRNPS